MRTVLLAATLVALAGSALAEERVFYCTDTANTGFIWQEGQTEGQVASFTKSRYIIKVLSETKRTVTQTAGSILKGIPFMLTCRKPYSHRPDFFACDRGQGSIPWLFQGSNFVRAFMPGRPVGGDPNIVISYGTCTGF